MRTQNRGSRAVRIILTLVALAGLSIPAFAELSAQAVCSAPHSSPTLAQSGSLRTLPTGGGWFQTSIFGQRATRFFDPNGDRRSFLAGAEFDTRSVFLTGAVGILTGLEIWGQIPLHVLDIESAGGNSSSSGVGDFRLAVRVGPEAFGLDLPLALRLGAKIPGADFPVDATVLPLTEGQRDWELSFESGLTFFDDSGFFSDTPLYLMGWGGYRWREENTQAARKPGDEVFAHLAIGGSRGNWSWEVAGDGLWGRTPRALGLAIPGDRRRLIQILPTIGRALGPGRVETTAQIPLSGKNLPIGLGLSLGYRITWGLMPQGPVDLRDFFGG